ncbi:MAG: DUF1294 domain-containing protein [Phycisphaerales bacterium]
MWIIIALCLYAAISVATFLVYWRDKRAARRGRQRVPERTLHMMSLAGGWAGAITAMHMFRHKTRTRRFLNIIVLAFLLHLILWLAILF